MGHDTSANPYEAVLADLRERKQEIEVAIAAISRLAGIDAAASASSSTSSFPRSARLPGSTIQPDTFFNMPTQDAVKKCLEIKKKTLPATEIRDCLLKGGIIHDAKNFYNSVYTALTRLRDAGEVVQLDNKEWGLAGWYQGRRTSSPKRKNASSEQANGGANGSDADETDEDQGDDSQGEVSLKAL